MPPEQQARRREAPEARFSASRALQPEPPGETSRRQALERPGQGGSPRESATRHAAPTLPRGSCPEEPGPKAVQEPKAPGGPSCAGRKSALPAPQPGDASPSREQPPAPEWEPQAGPAQAERTEAPRAAPKPQVRRPPLAGRPRQALRSCSGSPGEQQPLAEVLPVDSPPWEHPRVRPLPALERGLAAGWPRVASARLEWPPCSPVPAVSPAWAERPGELAEAASQQSPAGAARQASPWNSAV